MGNNRISMDPCLAPFVDKNWDDFGAMAIWYLARIGRKITLWRGTKGLNEAGRAALAELEKDCG